MKSDPKKMVNLIAITSLIALGLMAAGVGIISIVTKTRPNFSKGIPPQTDNCP